MIQQGKINQAAAAHQEAHKKARTAISYRGRTEIFRTARSKPYLAQKPRLFRSRNFNVPV
jgi:hypothetical protein